MLRLPRILRQNQIARKRDTAAHVEEPMNMDSVVGNDIEVNDLKGHRSFLQGIVQISQSIGHQGQVTRGAVHNGHVQILLDLDLRDFDRINISRQRRPPPGRNDVGCNVRQNHEIDNSD